MHMQSARLEPAEDQLQLQVALIQPASSDETDNQLQVALMQLCRDVYDRIKSVISSHWAHDCKSLVL